MPRALNLIRKEPHYRRDAFDTGLQRAGFTLMREGEVGPGDVLLIWNRYWHWHEIALRAEARGATVLVAENGYLGKHGTSPKFDVKNGPKPGHYYALGIGWHNGRGRWPQGDGGRFKDLEVELKDWRASGEHILVCPNRSFGVGEQIMPADWAASEAELLKEYTDRPIRVRGHPGNNAPSVRLEDDLRGAWAAVVWSSSVAQHALALGIPTFIGAPYQIVKSCGASGSVEEPVTPDRQLAFQSMTWAQWRLEEIETGEPFRAVLSAARQGQVSAPA